MRDNARTITVLGLVVGAIGIGVLWAAGVEFPVAIPPGIVILLAGALLVGLTRCWWWSPGVGAFLGVFVAVGWAISPTGWGNLTGRAGGAVALGQAIQLIGVLTALVAGVTATVRQRRARVAA
ncbi:hypothetical protein [Micromonospora globispora]|uniref:hypothetical protein n=1 Tax=Micromonospora globispora TaxID=1450148 RepID=UPI000F5E8593|nr:hypothetical protein [Micromonospora globispora]RQW85636.1 hypothetical protein DKL51_28365 [Micromonospora globispora]